jgi:RNA polymerase-binding transcription factor DksA
MTKTLKARYQDIVLAMEKIDADTYGFCETCGAPVEQDRLNVNPAARTCKAHMNG